MIDADLFRLLTRIAEALERISYLLETEPINVKIPNLHPAMTVEDLRLPDLTDEEADAFFEALDEGPPDDD